MKKVNSIWTIIIVAIISALIGGTISGVVVSHNNNNSQSNEAGTAQVADVSSKTSSGKAGNQMSAAFKNVSGAVVSVVNYQKQSNSMSDSIASLFGNDNAENSGTLSKYSEGSGAIYSNKDGKGYIVTNNHVVSGADKLEIIFKDGSKTTGKLIGTDKVTDLAVIEIDGSKVPATASFGDSSKISEGDQVIAIGSPLGSEYATSVTEGIISSKSRTVTTQDQTTGQDVGQATVIQTDAAINAGNSGGPLVNSNGQIIGINSMKLTSGSDGTSVEGMGFAIPSNEVVKIINALVKDGKIKRPSLGIKAIDLDQIAKEEQTNVLKLPSSVTKGVIVASVTNNSSAKNAGLSKYDVITKIDNKKVESISELHTVIYSHSIGDTVSITYYHSGNEKTTKITLK